MSNRTSCKAVERSANRNAHAQHRAPFCIHSGMVSNLLFNTGSSATDRLPDSMIGHKTLRQRHEIPRIHEHALARVLGHELDLTRYEVAELAIWHFLVLARHMLNPSIIAYCRPSRPVLYV
eukprot:CAMPEP_0115870222 /NCGR_PEP_ID=MMETSP0287-20121206/22211_1 /TAXON_ID=412157 /ORGANISM="Chrysochromulina rotalis, Strain UIO044" /LENGTH=120 /DNA_ID=CAMNT_0003324929 /DNA_START=176 /DNA_END=539 /DNA_ORIENTATION=-